ncbi:unnamed protein product [Closterium sp. NIES-54]
MRRCSGVFLGFPPDAPGWKFYHPTSRRVFPSQDVTFDELVPFYHLFPYHSAPPPPPPLFLALGPPPVDPLPPHGPAPSGVSLVDPLPGTVPVEVAVDSGAAQVVASGGAAAGGAERGGAEPGGAESGGAEPGGAESEGAGSGGAEPGGAECAGVESLGAEPVGVEPGGAESWSAEPRGIASSRGPAGATPRLSPCPEPLSSQQLREWFTQRTRLRSGAAGAGDSATGDTGAGGARSESASPPSVGGECALGTDVLEDRQEDFECLAAAAAMDAEMVSWKSKGTYVDAIPLSRANIVDGMWIFRVKRPPSSPPVFKARYVARGFSQRQGVDYFQTFSPIPKMTTPRVLLHVTAQRDYQYHSLDFSTAFLQGSLYEEIWLRRPPGFTGLFPAGTKWSLRWPVYGLRQAPHEWNDTLRTILAALRFTPSTSDTSLFLRTDSSLPPFYVLVYVDDLVFATADTEALTLVKSELQKRHTCTDLGELRSYLGLQITRNRARRTITLTQSHMVHQVFKRFGFQFSSPQPTPLSTGHSL